MLKKKHSEINIKLPLRPYSPLRNKTPPVLQPSPRNLSPMKNAVRNIQSRTPRKMSQIDPQFRSNTPRVFQNYSESQLQSFSAMQDLRNEGSHRFPAPKCAFRSELTTDLSYFSNVSNLSKEPALKQTKRLFTRCIAQMNSEKRKVCAERSNNTSNAASVAQNSKQVISESKSRGDGAPVTSFKALKIQMIESVLPEKRMNTVERRVGECQPAFVREREEYKTREFLVEQPRKEQIIQLINHSFSNAGRPEESQQTTPLEAKANGKILESVYVEEESDYVEFDQIMRKIQFGPIGRKVDEPEQVVKMSIESGSGRGSLTMDPFY